MSSKKKNVRKSYEEPSGNQQQILNDNNKQASAAKESDSFQPHNAKKEGLGPNTKR